MDIPEHTIVTRGPCGPDFNDHVLWRIDAIKYTFQMGLELVSAKFDVQT